MSPECPSAELEADARPRARLGRQRGLLHGYVFRGRGVDVQRGIIAGIADPAIAVPDARHVDAGVWQSDQFGHWITGWVNRVVRNFEAAFVHGRF